MSAFVLPKAENFFNVLTIALALSRLLMLLLLLLLIQQYKSPARNRIQRRDSHSGALRNNLSLSLLLLRSLFSVSLLRLSLSNLLVLFYAKRKASALCIAIYITTIIKSASSSDEKGR